MKLVYRRYLAVAGAILAVILATLATAGSAFAGQKAGVTMPDSIRVADKTLVLNGMGLREATIFNVDVYVAGLYLERKTASAQEILTSKQVKRLLLVFKRDLSRSDMVDAWRDGFKTNGGKALPSLRDRVKQLSSWMADVDKGQRMTFTYVPGSGIEVSVKGQRKGLIPGDDFAKVFFSIWLGPKPPNKGLRSGLLGH